METVLGRGAEFRGELRSSGSVRVDGCLEGFVRTSAELIVGQTGRVVADVEAASVLVAGELQGQVKSSGRIEIAPSGRLRGDVETAVLVVRAGGRLEGRCTMASEAGGTPVALVPSPAGTAPPAG